MDRKENTTHSRKGALTTARPLLVNARLTGETCATNFADTCYTASGPRAGSLTDKVQHKRKMNEWVTECATHIFPSKNQEFTHPEKKGNKGEKRKKGKKGKKGEKRRKKGGGVGGGGKGKRKKR